MWLYSNKTLCRNIEIGIYVTKYSSFDFLPPQPLKKIGSHSYFRLYKSRYCGPALVHRPWIPIPAREPPQNWKQMLLLHDKKVR